MVHVHPRVSLSYLQALAGHLGNHPGRRRLYDVFQQGRPTHPVGHRRDRVWTSGWFLSIQDVCFPGHWKHGGRQAHLGVTIQRLHPAADAVRDFEAGGGMTAIYEDRGARKACCGMRKLVPLRGFAGKSWWITGLRNAQSENRSGMEMVEEVPDWGAVKFHPLLDWSDALVEAAIAETGMPVNPLHALGYPSIGCAPCTRPVLPHEPARAGRWWWEQSSRECGLHKG